MDHNFKFDKHLDGSGKFLLICLYSESRDQKMIDLIGSVCNQGWRLIATTSNSSCGYKLFFERLA